ncbi:hypothetical protein Q4I30_007479 [Leishmania utingensis]|uniref:Uncharacterized protein n=1 Tax=Leishmania utingensis TaxID=653362 RepID=A0AAW2ZYE6_9TRYP
MRSTETPSQDMAEPLPSAPLLEVATSTRSPPPGGDDGKREEVTMLSGFSSPVSTVDASTLVGPTARDKLTKHPVEKIVVANEGASTPSLVGDTTQLRITKRLPFLADTEGTEVILGETSQGFLSSPLPSSATTCNYHCTPQHSTDASSPEDKELDRHVDGGDDDDAARGNAIQDKYNITSGWVDNLPPGDSTASLDKPMHGTASSEVPSVAPFIGSKKRRRGGAGGKHDPANGGGGERKRRAQRAEDAEVQAAFKHSQRVLRKQAKSVNMRDVFSQTLSLPLPLQVPTDTLGNPSSFPSKTSLADTPTNGSDANADAATTATAGVSSSSSLRIRSPACSPASLLSPSSPSSSSVWSPGVVGELTSRFLAQVQQQKRQKFEQMVSRELTQSQTLSQTQSLTQHPRQHDDAENGQGSGDGEYNPRTCTYYGMANDFTIPVDELVIGDEDNEAANWMPADPSSPTSQHARRMIQRDPVTSDETVLLGASSGEEGRFASCSNTLAEGQKAEDEEVSQQQEQVMRSLARKHEIWKLKQQQLRAQEQVELDERAKAMQKQRSTKLVTAVTAAAASSGNIHFARGDAEGTPATPAPLFTCSFRTYQASATGIDRGDDRGGVNATVAPRSTQSAKLSAEAISMIRRINSFDNTSTQRVVVFGTAASKQGKDKRMQR